MRSGIEEFRANYPDWAGKIDSDPHISGTERKSFWACIDTWNELVPLEGHAADCCNSRQLCGSVHALASDEKLGTAQERAPLERHFATTKMRGSALPPLTKAQVRRRLGEVLSESDAANWNSALLLFHAAFGPLPLRSRDFGVSARIFAFCMDKDVELLFGRSLSVLFELLAIPSDPGAEYLILAFKPLSSDRIHKPTCFDANVRNLPKFIPGGTTAGGIPEVVVTPPYCRQVTDAPRRIS